MFSFNASAQRQQNLGRGVVATYSSSKGVFINWRRLVQDPAGAKFNVYVDKTGGTSYTKINATPVNGTNYTASASSVPAGASVCVTMIGKDGVEGPKSVPFKAAQVKLEGTGAINGAVLAVNFKEAGSPIYSHDGADFVTKFCWPVDLDGDGEMEYVVNRVYVQKDQNGCEGWGDDKLGGDCLEAYSRDGKHLWTVNLGIHFYAFGGQNDGVTVGDFDGDGKGEVVVQVAEGARFWDKANNTFGKYLYYNGEQASHTGTGMETVSSDGSNPDIDGDGVTNYTYYSAGKNPQWYFVVIDGMTGAQKDVFAMTLPSDNDNTYTRTNKKDYMGDEYSYLSPAMGTAYLDGVHQCAVGQFQCRTSNGTHHYYTYAYGYVDGVFKELWRFKFHDYSNLSEFHHIRIGDVDGDGKDEVMNGQCAVDHDGTLLWTSGISHGDRFRMSDIDPERPGLEIFAIQQNAPDMLGQILYDAGTGKAVKKWYLSAVGDVGRGECMDVDPEHIGWEMWSTMPNIYNAKGDIIGEKKPYPYEGIWWDNDLGRETVMTPGSGNNCAIVVAKFVNGDWSRLYQISRDANWRVVAENAVRPMFWGDILGDWREEMILKNISLAGEECGFVVFSTDYANDVDNIYCLLQDPNYFGQITNRGYYQSPNPGFYLGWDMPLPQIPPFIQADEKTQVFDLTLGDSNINPSETAEDIYVMPVKGQTLTMYKSLDGNANLWKSQPGTLVVNGDISTEGKVVVSEGTLEVNGTVRSDIELRARGILTGSGTINEISIEGSLNYAEGVIRPTGTMTFERGLEFNSNIFVELDIDNNAKLAVKGDLVVNSNVTFIIDAEKLSEGEYRLIEYTGEFIGNIKNFDTRGISGLSYNIIDKDGAIIIRVNGQREASSGVKWTGAQSTAWEYQTENWLLAGTPTTFVANDTILFDDTTDKTTVTVDELIPTGGIEVNASQKYTFDGNGGFSGDGGLTKNGNGTLYLNNVKSNYKGATVINEGTVVVKELADAGAPSSIGAAGTATKFLQIGKATLRVDNKSCGTTRGVTLLDTATINIPSGTTAFKGNISGDGILRKTGAGQLNITYSAATQYAGTILEGGTLAQGTWNTTFGKATSPLHVTGNATIVQFDSNSSSAMPDFQNEVTVDANKTVTFKAGSRTKIRGKLLGTGTFAISFPYVRGDVYTDASKFEGTYDVLTSNCRFVQAMDFSKATLKMESGSYAAGFGAGGGTEKEYNFKVGALAGEGTLATGNWSIGHLGLNDTFSGVFKSSAKVTKVGEGALILKGASETDITVNEGALYANNTSANTTSGTITVKEGAILTGQGQVANVVVNAGGAIGAQGLPTSPVLVKTLTLNGTLQVNLGNVNVRYKSNSTKTSYDTFKQNKKVTLSSPTFVFSSIDGTEILDETEFKIFTGTGAIEITGDVTFFPETPKEGYKWDASTLQTDGTIRMMVDTGVDEILRETVKADDKIYTLTGVELGTVVAPGYYIINNNTVYVK